MWGRESYFYILIAILLGGMIYVSAVYFRGSGRSVVGVAVAQGHRLTAEQSGIVSRIYVMPGQQVRSGDSLVVLTSVDLQIEMQKVEQRLENLYRERDEKDKLLASEMAFVHAQTEINVAEIQSEIEKLRMEEAFNRQLVSAMNDAPGTDSLSGPVSAEVQSLMREIARHRKAMEIKQADLRQEYRSDLNLLQGQIRLYEKERQVLKEKNGRLSMEASSDGVVEIIYVQEGESIEPYAPLLRIRPGTPTSVVGYASMPVRITWQIGDEVKIKAAGSPEVVGKVIGFGEVVALPDVLQQSTAAKAFGREIFIEVAPGSSLASGEKVLIQ